MLASRYQAWLIGASVVMLGIGAWQIVWRPSCDRRRSRTSLLVLCVSAAIVLGVVFMPEAIAGFLADRVAGEGGAPAELTDVSSLDELKREFNAASDRVRVITLLSPT